MKKTNLIGKYSNFLTKFRLPGLILVALTTVTLAVGLLRININPEMDIFMPKESKAIDLMEKSNLYFGNNQQIIAAVKIADDLELSQLSTENFEAIKSLQQKIETIANISFVSMPNNLNGITLHNNNVYAMFSIFPDENFDNNNMKELEELIANSSQEYAITGNIFLREKTNQYIISVLKFLPFTAFFLILLIFSLQLRSIKKAFLSIIPAIVAAVWTFGIIGWIGHEVSIITAIAPIFTIVIGSAAGLHYISHFSKYRETENNEVSNKKTIAATLMPIVITTATSGAGFISLLLMKASGISDLAIASTIGITLAGITTFTILPLILAGKMNFQQKANRSRASITLMKNSHGLPAIIFAVILISGGVFGSFYVKTNFTQLSMFKKSTEVYEGAQLIQELTGGKTPSYIILKTESDILDPINATAILNFQEELEKSEAVTRVFSTFQGLAQGQYPQTKEQASQKLSMISQKIPELSKHINTTENAARIIVFTRDSEHITIEEIKKLTENFSSKEAEIEAGITGFDILTDELNESVKPGLIKSLLLAFAIVFLMLLPILKSLKKVLISLLPVIITTLVLFGFIGITGITLNLITAAIFSITIGVGIDYAVHFSSAAEKEGCINHAFSVTSTPIIANSLGLAIGMSALFLSPFAIHTHLAILMWLTMIVSMLLTLTLLPTLLRKSYKKNTKLIPLVEEV
ncbi:MAG: MMPL family transporter [Spirochaetales bacterium]|nr:MMPL family transporter [Spirochaetales bacterium]